VQTLLMADGTRIAFSDSGSGRPYVFVHGWTLDQNMWDYHVHHLSKTARCVRYDRRGHGASSVPDGGYDADTLAGDLAALLDHLDLRDVTLVTHSMGSVEAVRYLATRGSGRVAAVVLIASGSPLALRTDDNPDGVPPEQLEAALDALADDRAQWFDAQRAAYFALPDQADRTSEAMVQLTWQQCLQTPLPVQTACMRTMVTTDLRADFSAVDVPVTLLHGALDQSTPLATCGIPAAALLPRGTLHVVDDAGHGIYVTHRSEVLAELRLAAPQLAPA
jgi:non-heme chloroperoxidase